MEADAIMFTEHQMRSGDEAQSVVHYPEVINIASIRVSHLYAKMYVMVSRCMEICGLYRYTVKIFVKSYKCDFF